MLLRQKILVEAASAIDIPPEASEPGTEALAFPLPEEEEVRQALLEAGNTAPGDDEITMPPPTASVAPPSQAPHGALQGGP